MTELIKPYFIGIAGESGVGKTTMANAMAFFLGEEKTLIISTDDLHKWERTSSMWNQFTHSDPRANNLDLGDWQMAALAKGEAIYRSRYNHDIGHFSPPHKLAPLPYIINEGLHAFFSDKTNSVMDLRIFVDTNDDLRIHWKILRDTVARGYNREQVMLAIAKRRADDALIRDVQLKRADVIVRLTSDIASPGNSSEDSKLAVEISFKEGKRVQEDMLDFVGRSLTGKPAVLLAHT